MKDSTHKKNTDSLVVDRSEIKYMIGMLGYETLHRLLESTIRKDSYMKSDDGYLIRSLYFDSVSDKDYFDKLHGLENRKKIRLRIYDFDSDICKLEIKNRFNNYNLKESIIIDRSAAEQLIDKKFEVLKDLDSPYAQKAYEIMKCQLYAPKVIVEYDREAYTIPEYDIRITFDKNVRGSFSHDLYYKNHAMTPLCEPQTMILEVKFNNFLPTFLQDILSVCSGSMLSVSKYCLARDTFQ